MISLVKLCGRGRLAAVAGTALLLGSAVLALAQPYYVIGAFNPVTCGTGSSSCQARLNGDPQGVWVYWCCPGGNTHCIYNPPPFTDGTYPYGYCCTDCDQ
jgi:hypothetical protein